jgi:hypothetical protein
MLDTVAQALNANEEETAQDAVELLIEVCVTGVVQLDVWCISCCCWMLRCCPIYMHQWAAYMHVGTATHSTPTIQQLAEAHPRCNRYAVNMTPDFAGRANVMCNAFAEGNPRMTTFCMSSITGTAVFRDFSFVVF